MRRPWDRYIRGWSDCQDRRLLSQHGLLPHGQEPGTRHDTFYMRIVLCAFPSSYTFHHADLVRLQSCCRPTKLFFFCFHRFSLLHSEQLLIYEENKLLHDICLLALERSGL